MAALSSFAFIHTLVDFELHSKTYTALLARNIRLVDSKFHHYNCYSCQSNWLFYFMTLPACAMKRSQKQITKPKLDHCYLTTTTKNSFFASYITMQDRLRMISFSTWQLFLPNSFCTFASSSLFSWSSKKLFRNLCHKTFFLKLFRNLCHKT